MNYNRVIIAGRLTGDPEIRYTPKGNPVASGSIAVNRKWKNDAGQPQEEVSFFNYAAFGRTAEVMKEYCRKGSELLFEGRLKQERWEDRNDGSNRQAVKIIVEAVQLGHAKESDPQRPLRPVVEPGPPTAKVESSGEGNPDGQDDDVPF